MKTFVYFLILTEGRSCSYWSELTNDKLNDLQNHTDIGVLKLILNLYTFDSINSLRGSEKKKL